LIVCNWRICARFDIKEILKDIDIVAVGSGIELALKVSQLLPKQPKVQVFKTYGTAMLRFEDTEIEFVEQERILPF
jgi:tRNA nucleotidyltransferase (CCA-adding enzyme)